jgi:hypothetical protein
MSNDLSESDEQDEPFALTKVCIRCNNSIRAGSIRCRICGSEDPFGNEVARKRSSLISGAVAIAFFSMLFLVFYEILPIIATYARFRH